MKYTPTGDERSLDLRGRTLPAGTALPESLRWLSLGGGSLPAGTAIPRGCEVRR